MSMCYAMPWLLTRSTGAAFISVPPSARCMHLRTAATPGILLSVIFRPCCRSKFRRYHDPSVAPSSFAHAGARGQRGAARGGNPPTLSAVLDALEARYPVLRGTVHDQITGQRQPFVRFFACKEDLSHHPPDSALPEAVASSEEPLLVIGAIAGG
jgi:sulfur-carrier protein